jgi:hypothetical protein
MCFAEAQVGSSGSGRTVLASTSKDDLIVMHDPALPTEERALMLVMNIGAPVREVGFFGPMCKGLYLLTGNKMMHIYHWDLEQRVCNVHGRAGGAGFCR